MEKQQDCKAMKYKEFLKKGESEESKVTFDFKPRWLRKC